VTKLLRKTLLAAAVLVIVCLAVVLAGFGKPYRVGQNIHNLDPDRLRDAYFSIRPISYPSFKSFEGVDWSSFSGNLILSRPETPFHDGAQLDVEKGKLIYHVSAHEEDPEFKRDITSLQTNGLAPMLANTKNDWRVSWINARATNFKMTGTIEVSKRSGCGWDWTINVEKDVILSAQREFGCYF
jgi:hypothetical protein